MISNAILYGGKEHPVLNIDYEATSDGWNFAFKDNGIGIIAEHHDTVFNLFYRTFTRDDVKGEGIGLTICKKIVMNHGGDISLESSPGKGSTFNFYLSKGL